MDCERPGMGRAVDTEEENGGAAGGKSASGDVVASYLPLVDFLAEVLGPTAEVVLHDLRRKGHSMVAIRNGELTGRRAGDATATEAALRMARRAEERGEPYAANHFGQPAGDKILRSSTYFIRDEKRNVVGILGVNVDLTQLMAARQTVDRLLGLVACPPSPSSGNPEGRAGTRRTGTSSTWSIPSWSGFYRPVRRPLPVSPPARSARWWRN